MESVVVVFFGYYLINNGIRMKYGFLYHAIFAISEISGVPKWIPSFILELTFTPAMHKRRVQKVVYYMRCYAVA